MAAPQRTPENSNFKPRTGPRTTLPDTSRDPRRMPRDGPPPQNNPPTQGVQGTVHILRQLTVEVAELTHITGARNHVMKKRKAEDQALKKAKERVNSYPSLIQGLRSAINDRDKELKIIEDRFNTHTANKEKILLSLANIIHTPPSQVPQHDQIEKDLDGMNEDIHLIRERNRTMFSRLNTTSQRVDSLRDDVNFLLDSIKQTNEKDPPNDKLQLFQDDMNLRLGVLSAAVDTFKFTLKEENNNRDKSLRSLDQKIEDVTASLSATKADLQKDSKRAEENLQSALKSISEETSAMVEGSRELLSRIDEGFESKISTMEKAVDEATQSASNAHKAIDRLNQDLVNLHKAVTSVDPHAINQRFSQLNNHLAGSINTLHGQLTATHSAVHSLESRYSQLVTEPIIRQMIIRMQDMYPHASRVQSEIERLLNTLNEHIMHINSHGAKIAALEEGQEQAKKANKSLIDFLHIEKNEIIGKIKAAQTKADELEESLLQSLAELGADVKGAMEVFNDMKAQVQLIAGEKPAPSIPQFQTSAENGVSSTSSGVQGIPSYGLSATQSNSDNHRHKKRKLGEETPGNPEPSNNG